MNLTLKFNFDIRLLVVFWLTEAANTDTIKLSQHGLQSDAALSLCWQSLFRDQQKVLTRVRNLLCSMFTWETFHLRWQSNVPIPALYSVLVSRSPRSTFDGNTNIWILSPAQRCTPPHGDRGWRVQSCQVWLQSSRRFVHLTLYSGTRLQHCS